MIQAYSPEEVRVAWTMGELGYRLRNSQRVVRAKWQGVRAKFLKFYIECTRRFGKSTLMLMILTEIVLKHPGSKAGYYAPVKEGLSDYIQPIIEKVYADCPEDLRPVLDSTLTLNFPFGSQIIFRGSNNKQHRVRRGNDLIAAAIDEGRDVDDLDTLVDSVVIPSLFTSGGNLIIGSTPADTEDHPLHIIKQAAEKEGWYSHFTIDDARRYDPAEFPLERIEQFRKETKDPVAWEREYMAKWVKDPTKIIVPEWNDSYFRAVPRDEYFQWYHKYVALDSGVRDKTAGIFGYYDFKRAALIIEREFTLKDAEVITEKIAKQVKDGERDLAYQPFHDRKSDDYKKLAQNEKTHLRVADNNNLILVNDLNTLYDLDFFPTRKDELAAMINLAREWIKDGRILVNPVCTELRGCLTNAIWDKNKKELARSKVYGHFDALMALVYLVRNVDTSTNPIPKYFGKSWATHPGVPVNAHEPANSAQQLARLFSVKSDRQKAREDFARGNLGA